MKPDLRKVLERARQYIKPAHPGDIQADADLRAVDDALATFQPSGEGREGPDCQPFERYPELAAEIMRMASTGQTGSGIEWQRFTDALNDALLASGLVQDEASIRRDEREKCAAEVESRNWPCVGDARRIAAAIRSARDGGAET